MNLVNQIIKEATLPDYKTEQVLWSSLRFYSLQKLRFHDSQFAFTSALDKFVDHEGQIWRDVKHYRTNTSRDCVLGLLLALTQIEEPMEYVEKIYSYWKDNNWSIGGNHNPKDADNRNKATWSMRHVLGRFYKKYTGSIPQGLDVPHTFWVPTRGGYPRHLNAMAFILLKELDGYVSFGQDILMKYYAWDEPDNALFQALGGSLDKTNKAMDKWFPKDRIRNHTDQVEPYLWQRCESRNKKNFQPGKDPHRYQGIDYLIVKAMTTYIGGHNAKK